MLDVAFYGMVSTSCRILGDVPTHHGVFSQFHFSRNVRNYSVDLFLKKSIPGEISLSKTGTCCYTIFSACWAITGQRTSWTVPSLAGSASKWLHLPY